MRFTVDKAALEAAVVWAGKAVPARPTVPVLAGSLLSVAGGELTVTGFDLEQVARCTVPVDADVDGEALVSGRLLGDIAKALPAGQVSVELADGKLVITAARSRFTLPTMNLVDYPKTPSTEHALGTVDGNGFAEGVERIVGAAGKDDSLPILTAVSVALDPAEGTITFAATDRYRFAIATTTYTPASTGAADKQVFLIPARTLSTYAKAINKAGTVELASGADGTLLSISSTNGSVTTRLMDGAFPEYERLMPTEFRTTIDLPVAELQAALKRVTLVAHRTDPCNLTFADGSVSLTAGTQDEGSSRDAVSIDYAGEEFTVAFNPNYINDGLHGVGEANARMSFIAPTKPAVITNSEGTFRYLVMPIRTAR